MFDLDDTGSSDSGSAGWGDTMSVPDDRSSTDHRVYVTGDGTERAAWALRCYLRAAGRGGDAGPRQRPA